MKVLQILLVGFLLLVLCWPLFVAALLLWPLFWLLSIPFRIVGIVIGAVLAALKALLFLPARLLIPISFQDETHSDTKRACPNHAKSIRML